jgi:N-acetyl sugar amidotransferase
MKSSHYQQCTNCILDTNDDEKISFDDSGVCNYCRDYISKYVVNGLTDSSKEERLKELIQKIKSGRRKKKYDCIMGLSGGVDSSYLAFIAKQKGLNPLMVHFDNGWNSELAVKNIEGILRKTGFDLYTYVVDWNEFKDLQLSYIKAGVLDWEIPTDHGFYACLHHQAYKHGIKYVLTGHNYQTEAILPNTMRWSKMDVANIKDIHSKFGKVKLKTFPMLNFFTFSWYKFVLKLERINLLELVHYNKEDAKETIKREFGWVDYGGKHYESIFTRFYQGYILKEKFGFDKRKAHLSNLILSGQISREKALTEVSKPPYDPDLLEEDFNYVAKKFDLSPDEFREIIARPNHSHLDYKSYETGLYQTHIRTMRFLKPVTRLFKKLISK